MLVNKTELKTGYDCDNTLVIEDINGSLSLPYGGKIKNYRVHTKHVELLKNHKSRGFHITVWSQNGWQHAVNIVKALGLEEFVDVVESKMICVVDDKKDLESIVGSRIFLEE